MSGTLVLGQRLSLPPGPARPWPVQLLEYVYRPTELLDGCARRYGEVFTLRLGGAGTLVVVHDPAHVREVFTAPPTVLNAGESNGIARPIVGDRSVFVLGGSEHLERRRLLLPPFHGARLRSYARTIEEISERCTAGWRLGETRALHEDLKSITLEAIMRVVFGVYGPELEALSQAFRDLFRPVPAIASFVPAFQVAFPASPFWFWLRKRHRVIGMLRSLVDARRGDANLDERTDVLSTLLSARDEDGNALDDVAVYDELITAVVAGHETTATALAWVFERILAHPTVESTLREELAADDSLEGGRYLDAVLKEALRQRPPLPLVARAVSGPFSIGGHDLPEGVFVAPCMWLTHHRADLYEAPEVFRPERWFDVKPDPYRFYPFGGGVRRCVGMAFATLEMKVVVATLLRAGRFELVDAPPLATERRSITLYPRAGTRVRRVAQEAG